MNRMKPLRVFAVVAVVCLPFATLAQIKTDASLGRPAQTLSGPAYVIPQSLGKLVGGNLFHSFQTFNINSGQSAAFTTSSAGINNVISRVTGGNTSLINGELSLKAASGSPNLYFINPAGITFGAGASIDVPGAFHVSTADYLKFPDGNFYANTTSGSTFSSVEPVAFGFLGATNASVIVKDGGRLSTQPQQNVSVIAGDIAVMDSSITTTKGGNIRMLAFGKQMQEVGMTGQISKAEGGLSFINADIGSDTNSNTNAGSVKVGAGWMIIDSARIYSSTSGTSSTGNSGDVEVIVGSNLTIQNDGYVFSSTASSGKSGSVNVSTGSLLIDGSGSSFITGIFTEAHSGTGNAGIVNVTAKDQILIRSRGKIYSSTFSSGNAGAVKVSADTLIIDGRESEYLTGIFSSTDPNSTGNAGNVNVAIKDQILIRSGGKIRSDTFSSTDAGIVTVSARELIVDGIGNDIATTGIFSEAISGTGDAGRVDVAAIDQLTIKRGGVISTSSKSYSTGDAGKVKVSAGSLTIDGDGSETASGILSETDLGSFGNAGSVDVVVKDQLTIQNGGQISSSTGSAGNAGSVKVAAGSLLIDGGGGIETGIMSDARLGSTSSAGSVEVAVRELLAIKNFGQISSDTYSSGDAGSVKVSAGSLMLENSGHISSDTWSDGTGNAGNVDVVVTGHLTIQNGGSISSDSFSLGNAGSVKVSSGSLTIDGSTMDGSGAGDLHTGIFSQSGIEMSSSGNVDVTVIDHLTIKNFGWISSDTNSSGNAGSVKVRAGSLTMLDSGDQLGSYISSDTLGSGNAGSVDVAVINHLSLIDGAHISSDTYSSGNAGSVKVSAGVLMIDGRGGSNLTGIYSDATTGSSGNAGSVEVATGQLKIQNGGWISSSTLASGKGGAIHVQANTIHVTGDIVAGQSGIKASAELGSSGQTDNVSVIATDSITLTDGGIISISNAATVNAPEVVIPGGATVSAPHVELRNGEITAASTGNVSASSISVNFAGQLLLENSSITTSANLGNGGSIYLRGGNQLNVERSQISTSVIGPNGNGGDINVSAKALVMNSGFIQANTAATNAIGGNVQVNVDTLLPSGNTLFLGGQTPYNFMPEVFGFNVIQAAAPTGVSGAINVTAPALDISGSLNGLNAKVIDGGKLGRNPCQATGGSSLAVAGRGGSAESARGWLGTDLNPDVIPPERTEANISTRKMAVKETGCRHL